MTAAVGRELPPGRGRAIVTWVVGLALFVLVLNLLLLGVRSATGGSGGPTSSSYATAADGLAAYADLLGRFDHPVARLRGPLAEADLDPADTLVLLDPGGLDEDQISNLRRFLAGGGRLITGGTLPEAWLPALVEDAPEWSFEGATRVHPVAPVPEVAGVDGVAGAGLGSWQRPAGSLPVLASDGTTVMSVAQRGPGRVVLLADPSMVQNQMLGRADNASLGIGLAGEPGRRVLFVESVHGYERAEGWGAVPENWRFVTYGMAVAALLYMVAKGRRLGPPEAGTRPLGPPRRAYVDSLGAILARTRERGEAAAPVQTAARRRVARMAGLEPGAADDDIRRAATRLGLADDEAEALLAQAASDQQVIASGRALARLEGGSRDPTRRQP